MRGGRDKAGRGRRGVGVVTIWPIRAAQLVDLQRVTFASAVISVAFREKLVDPLAMEGEQGAVVEYGELLEALRMIVSSPMLSTV